MHIAHTVQREKLDTYRILCIHTHTHTHAHTQTHAHTHTHTLTDKYAHSTYCTEREIRYIPYTVYTHTHTHTHTHTPTHTPTNHTHTHTHTHTSHCIERER